jgi:membrane-bound metal-dependent hydrolase YbcI (DUF457 family)
MLLRTHLAITAFAILVFIPHITYPLIFSIVCLIASLIPDIDTYFSSVGGSILAKIVQFFTKHRGMIHSLSFAILLSIALGILSPLLALPFFLGYGLHVFVDAFTIEGVTPFWPYSRESKGLIKTGKYSDMIIFISFVILDLFMVIVLLL